MSEDETLKVDTTPEKVIVKKERDEIVTDDSDSQTSTNEMTTALNYSDSSETYQ